MRQFNIMYNIGRAKYVVNFHDGQQTHADGSPFFGIAIFSNKRKMATFIRELNKRGYIRRDNQ